MFQYAAGRALAARHGVELAFDTTWYDVPAHQVRVKRAFDLHHFRIRGRVATIAELRPYVTGPASWFARCQRRWWRALARGQIWYDESPGWTPAFNELGPRTSLEGYFQHPAYFEDVAEAIRTELQPKEPLPGTAAAFADQLRGRESVCIQVRRTDFLSTPETEHLHGTCPPAYFEQAWTRMLQQVCGARGFVFPDDHAWAHETFAAWPDVEVVGPEWDGPSYLHKFQLMQSCRHFIIANSTWGWWAAWLAPSHDRKVIMPARWYADSTLEAATTELQLPGWERI
jgi:hypothetical protein